MLISKLIVRILFESALDNSEKRFLKGVKKVEIFFKLNNFVLIYLFGLVI